MSCSQLTKTNLTLPERALATELAWLLADFLNQRLPPQQGIIYNQGQSNFEAACHALKFVGVMEQAGHNTAHRFVVPLPQITSHMRTVVAMPRRAFDALLSAYVENYCNYDRLSPFRAWFKPNPRDLTVMGLLSRCGYVEAHEGLVRWTDKIGPVMQHWHLWDKQNICHWELKQNAEDAILDHLERTLPPALRRKFMASLGKDHPNDTFQMMRAHVAGREWSLFEPAEGPSEEVVRRACFRLMRQLPEAP